MQDAMAGRGTFTATQVSDGVYRFDYKDAHADNFTVMGRTLDEQEWKRAWLRREMRGLVMRNTGEVVVRGLHKFFNIGQLKETKLHTLSKLQVVEVLEKLDGQMIVGVAVGDRVQYWSQKGNTAVGVTARRLAQQEVGDYDGLVMAVCNVGATAVFEMVGCQSRIKSDEGMQPRLVLTAVRQHADGKYWEHSELLEVGERHGIEVVHRLKALELIGL